jgi:hypothetical protein
LRSGDFSSSFSSVFLRYMRKFGTGAGEPAGHHLRPSFSLPSPEGGEKTRLGGELRREEQLISRTGMCMDRVGTVDDLSEGFFACLSPLAPARPESHRSRGQALKQVRLN